MKFGERIIRKFGIIFKLSFFGVNLNAYLSQGGDTRFRYSDGLQKNGTVLDVGAFEGEFAQFHANTADRVICFDVNPSAIEKLTKHFEEKENVVICDYGIGSSDKRGKIIGKGAGAKIDFSDDAPIIIREVSKVFKELSIKRVSLLKINIEGGEFDLIKALFRTKLLMMIDEIHIQTHDFADRDLSQTLEMHRLLSEYFNLHQSFPFVWDFWHKK